MARAYCLDLRERVVAAVVRGKSRRAAAALFDISVASAVKWTQCAYETGSPAPRPTGGKRPFLLAAQRSWLLARLDEKPDLTLHTLLRKLGARGVSVSCDTPSSGILQRLSPREAHAAPSAPIKLDKP
jgi:transposase